MPLPAPARTRKKSQQIADLFRPIPVRSSSASIAGCLRRQSAMTGKRRETATPTYLKGEKMMRTHDGSPLKKALPMLLGVALSSWGGSLPVHAQDSTPPDTTVKSDVLSDDAVRQMFGEEALKNPETIPDPMPLNYPYAAPAGLDMRHWVDYSKTETRPGSASDVRFYKDKM